MKSKTKPIFSKSNHKKLPEKSVKRNKIKEKKNKGIKLKINSLFVTKNWRLQIITFSRIVGTKYRSYGEHILLYRYAIDLHHLARIGLMFKLATITICKINVQALKIVANFNLRTIASIRARATPRTRSGFHSVYCKSPREKDVKWCLV